MAYRTPWPICEACAKLPESLFFPDQHADQPTIHPLWPTFQAFQNSALQGCHVCTLLSAAIHEPYKQLPVEDLIPVFLESIRDEDSGTGDIALTVDVGTLRDHPRWSSILSQPQTDLRGYQYWPIARVKFVSRPDEVPSNAKHFKGLLSLYADDDGALRYIKQNLTDCLQSHKSTCDRVMFPNAAPSRGPGGAVQIVFGHHGLVVAPTRLVRVGSGDNNDDRPRIVDGSECLQHGYLTLSYCWGMTVRKSVWQLTHATMESFATALPMDVLPQTIVDAILWTRQLGERYIWIDSLCIIQDSKDDWRREAAAMASIYGSATLTLVAASSSVYGGLTDRRNPLRNCAAALDPVGGATGTPIYLLPYGQQASQPPEAPMEHRGWCFQENILSSRLVMIERNSIAWQCVKKVPGRQQALEVLTKHPCYRWYTLWYRFIERYTNKKLTFGTDKLRAFYGFACSKAPPGYIAGVIKGDPWASLLWCRDENQIRRRPGYRYISFVAPSWSWASIDAPVLFYEASGRHWRKPQLEPCNYDAKLVSLEATPESPIQDGAVTGGVCDFEPHILIAKSSPNGPYLFNTKPGSHSAGRRNLRNPLTDELVGLVVYDVAGEANDNMWLCCALLHTVAMSHWEENGTAGLGLALQINSSQGGRLECKRVGYVQLTSSFGKCCYRWPIRIT